MSGAEVEFFGETFTLAEEISEFALMEFAESAENADSETLAGLAAIMRLLREVVIPEDWGRFKATARKNKAKVEDVLPLAVSVFEVKTARPTPRPADSSDGPPATEPRSTSGSGSRAFDLLDGRPDLQVMVARMESA